MKQPREMSWEIIDEARQTIKDVLVVGPVDEEELMEEVSNKLYAFRSVGRYALSTFDYIEDDRGLISLPRLSTENI